MFFKCLFSNKPLVVGGSKMMVVQINLMVVQHSLRGHGSMNDTKNALSPCIGTELQFDKNGWMDG